MADLRDLAGAAVSSVAGLPDGPGWPRQGQGAAVRRAPAEEALSTLGAMAALLSAHGPQGELFFQSAAGLLWAPLGYARRRAGVASGRTVSRSLAATAGSFLLLGLAVRAGWLAGPEPLTIALRGLISAGHAFHLVVVGGAVAQIGTAPTVALLVFLPLIAVAHALAGAARLLWTPMMVDFNAWWGS